MHKRVMLIEDELGGNELSSHLLHRGYIVTKADSPSDAEDRVREFRPDVILLDPLVEGLNEKILVRLTDWQVKTIIFSNEKEIEMKQAVACGLGDDYFRKEEPLATLYEKIETAC